MVLPTRRRRCSSCTWTRSGSSTVRGTVLDRGEPLRLVAARRRSTSRATWRCTPGSATDPYFLLSVGGYNPRFQPPGGLPASVTNLRRMRAEVAISEDVWFALEAYVAVTSNTLQFGSQASLEASAKFLGVDLHGARRGRLRRPARLLAVRVHRRLPRRRRGHGRRRRQGAPRGRPRAHLEGPKPWYASGSAASTSSASTCVRRSRSAAPRAPRRRRARTCSSWSSPRSASRRRGAARSPPGARHDRRRPRGRRRRSRARSGCARTPSSRRCRRSRRSTRQLDRFGDLRDRRADDARRRRGRRRGRRGETAWEPVLDWFAPAQYDEMTRDREARGAVLRGDDRRRALRRPAASSFADAEAVDGDAGLRGARPRRGQDARARRPRRCAGRSQTATREPRRSTPPRRRAPADGDLAELRGRGDQWQPATRRPASRSATPARTARRSRAAERPSRRPGRARIAPRRDRPTRSCASRPSRPPPRGPGRASRDATSSPSCPGCGAAWPRRSTTSTR